MNKNRYEELKELAGITESDFERKSLFYVLSQNDHLYKARNSIYDFKNNQLYPESNFFIASTGIYKLLKLAINQYNYRLGESADFTDLDNKNFEIILTAIKIRRFNDKFLDMKNTK